MDKQNIGITKFVEKLLEGNKTEKIVVWFDSKTVGKDKTYGGHLIEALYTHYQTRDKKFHKFNYGKIVDLFEEKGEKKSVYLRLSASKEILKYPILKLIIETEQKEYKLNKGTKKEKVIKYYSTEIKPENDGKLLKKFNDTKNDYIKEFYKQKEVIEDEEYQESDEDTDDEEFHEEEDESTNEEETLKEVLKEEL